MSLRRSSGLRPRVLPGQPYDPPKLYRYLSLTNRALGEDRLGWARDTVVNSSLFLSSPKGFNDPSECRVVLTNEATEADWKQYLEPAIRREMVGAPEAAVQTTLLDAARKALQPEVFARIVADLQRDVDGLGILCLCETPLETLMWAHYADGHRGICLEFSHLNEPCLGRAQRVDYASSRPRVDALGLDPGEAVQALLLTKGVNWAYEREWRLVDHEVGAGAKIDFNPALLTGIVLGAKIPDDHRNAVQEWLRERALPVRLLQASVSHDNYAVELRDV